MSNYLKSATSPYLLQHAENPVLWYPWCGEAFEKASAEDKPVFLSIGYSTCHWCHVMAHESFEDNEIADILNAHFVCIKVDREERPDIDSIYMSVCQAFTGSGGWPTSIFMTPEQKPFFAGTYFPSTARRGSVGFGQLLRIIYEKWETSREELVNQADHIVAALKKKDNTQNGGADTGLIGSAIDIFKRSFDHRYGGFGEAPKFPAAHNLLFLMGYYQNSGDTQALAMAEKTMMQMHRGGLFDHIGGGFCRYSTDKFFLVPHFEKMLYDNALMIMAYSKAYAVTKNPMYIETAERTAQYVLREMRHEKGGFFSAQDADNKDGEGAYYVFEPSEIVRILGKEGAETFNRCFDITQDGNFEGKSIPNLLDANDDGINAKQYLPAVYKYRSARAINTDDKILLSWNAMMIAAMCVLYRSGKNEAYLDAARSAQRFIEENLCINDTLYVSFRLGKRGQKGFLDDYAYYIFALLALYEATLDLQYLKRARYFCRKTAAEFEDQEQGGFYLYSSDSESLILRPKETYDGAMPSGNSVMAYNLVRLNYITDEPELRSAAKRQLDFISAEARRYPAGYTMFLSALLDFNEPPEIITVVPEKREELAGLSLLIPVKSVIRVADQTDKYPLKGGRTTFYVCNSGGCLPPVNSLKDME